MARISRYNPLTLIATLHPVLDRLSEDYTREIIKRVLKPLRDRWVAMVLPIYTEALEDEAREVDEVRQDTDANDLRRAIEGLSVEWADEITVAGDTWLTEGVLQRMGQRTVAATANEAGDVFRSLLGVNPLSAEPYAAELLQNWNRENVALIQKLGGVEMSDTSMFRRMERSTWEGWNRGTTTRELTKQIEADFGMGQRHARLIARDQVSKLNGELTMARQLSVGGREYVWRTSQDERVRASHAEKDGVPFNWSVPPPDTGHPGWDFQCRCTAEPILTQLTGEPPEDLSETSHREAMRSAQARVEEAAQQRARSGRIAQRRPVGFRAPAAGNVQPVGPLGDVTRTRERSTIPTRRLRLTGTRGGAGVTPPAPTPTPAPAVTPPTPTTPPPPPIPGDLPPTGGGIGRRYTHAPRDMWVNPVQPKEVAAVVTDSINELSAKFRAAMGKLPPPPATIHNGGMTYGQWNALSVAERDRRVALLRAVDNKHLRVFEEYLSDMRTAGGGPSKWQGLQVRGGTAAEQAMVRDELRDLSSLLGRWNMRAAQMGDNAPAFRLRAVSRGEYKAEVNTVNLGVPNRRVIFHEMGHYIEEFNPPARSAVRQFLQMRVQQLTARRAKHVPGGRARLHDLYGTGSGERAWNNREWVTPYTGKAYLIDRDVRITGLDKLASNFSQDQLYGTEVLSMGLEMMSTPAGAMRLWFEDPEHFGLIHAILTGRFGRAGHPARSAITYRGGPTSPTHLRPHRDDQGRMRMYGGADGAAHRGTPGFEAERNTIQDWVDQRQIRHNGRIYRPSTRTENWRRELWEVDP